MTNVDQWRPYKHKDSDHAADVDCEFAEFLAGCQCFIEVDVVNEVACHLWYDEWNGEFHNSADCTGNDVVFVGFYVLEEAKEIVCFTVFALWCGFLARCDELQHKLV